MSLPSNTLYSEVISTPKKARIDIVASEARASTNTICDAFVEKFGNSPGLKPTKDRNGYQYMVGESFMNTDPFVRKSMKVFDKSMYDSIKGFSRKPDLKLTLDTLSNFSHTQARKIFRTQFEKDCWDKALHQAQIKFGFSNLLPISITEVVQRIEKSTSAGFSFPGKKKKDVIDELGSIARLMKHNIHDERYVYSPPAKIAQRGHLHDAENPKSRPVFVIPGETIILEGIYALPYIDRLKETKTVLIGPNSMKELIQVLNPVSDRDGRNSLALDWTAFDSSIPNWLIDEAFKIIKGSFALTHKKDSSGRIRFGKRGKDDETRARRSLKANRLMFKWITTNFKKTKIMLPNGVILKKMHGIPSGSFFTQAVGSICNYIVICFIMNMMKIQPFETSVLGDDSYTRFNQDGFSLDKAANIAKKYFKMTLNVKKSSIKTFSQPQKFLGYQTRGLTLVRPEEDFAKMVLYPERDVLTLEQSYSRVFAYYLLGGVNNPWYCKFYHSYLGHYSRYNITSFTLHQGMYRTLRYVAGMDVSPGQTFPFDPGILNVLNVAYHFRFGYDIYQR